MNGYNTNHVICAFDDNRLKATPVADQRGHDVEVLFFLIVHRQVIGTRIRKDDKLCQIERVGAIAQNLTLWPSLPAVPQERIHCLKVFAFGNNGGKRLRWRKRLTVSREHVTDLPLRERDQWTQENAELDVHQPVNTTALQF